MNIGGLVSSIEQQARDSVRDRSIALQISDALACLALARNIDEARHLVQFYGLDSGAADWERAAAAAAIIRLSECDSIHVPSCLTPAAIVVPVALARARDGKSMFKAIQTGTSVGLWIAESIGGVRALGRGVWPTLLAAPAMAAATASIAMGLDMERTEHAVALAISGSSGRLGRPSGTPSGRWLSIGEAVARGVRAADGAASGFRGDRTLPALAWLEAQRAGAVSERDADSEAVARIGLKPFVAARQGMNALAAFVSLGNLIKADEIEHIEVALPSECLPVVMRPLVAEDRLSRIANLAYRLAAAAIDPDSLLDPTGHCGNPGLAERIAATVAIGTVNTEPVEGSWPARVRVLAAGRWHEASCARCPGDAGDHEAQAGVVASKIDHLCALERGRLEGLLAAGEPDTILKRARSAFDHLLEPPETVPLPKVPVGVPCPAH